MILNRHLVMQNKNIMILGTQLSSCGLVDEIQPHMSGMKERENANTEDIIRQFMLTNFSHWAELGNAHRFESGTL